MVPESAQPLPSAERRKRRSPCIWVPGVESVHRHKQLWRRGRRNAAGDANRYTGRKTSQASQAVFGSTNWVTLNRCCGCVRGSETDPGKGITQAVSWAGCMQAMLASPWPWHPGVFHHHWPMRMIRQSAQHNGHHDFCCQPVSSWIVIVIVVAHRNHALLVCRRPRRRSKRNGHPCVASRSLSLLYVEYHHVDNCSTKTYSTISVHKSHGQKPQNASHGLARQRRRRHLCFGISPLEYQIAKFRRRHANDVTACGQHKWSMTLSHRCVHHQRSDLERNITAGGRTTIPAPQWQSHPVNHSSAGDDPNHAVTAQ